MFMRATRLASSVGSKGLREMSSGTAPITLYGFPMSQPYRSVKLLCHQGKISHTVVLVDALKGENRKPDYLKINPAGLVPAIKEGDFVLGVSLSYL